VRLDLILQFGELLVAGHAVKEAHHFEGLASIDELHLLQTIVGISGLFSQLLQLTTSAFLRFELLSETVQADGCDAQRFALAEAQAVLHHRTIFNRFEHRRCGISTVQVRRRGLSIERLPFDREGRIITLLSEHELLALLGFDSNLQGLPGELGLRLNAHVLCSGGQAQFGSF